MICLNNSSNNDSNDSAISYSLSLSSSPVKSSAIKQLLESPIIKSSSQSSQCSERSVDSDTDLDPNDDFNEIIVAESPERSPIGSQEDSQTLDVSEVPSSQPIVTNDEPSSDSDMNQNSIRNCLRRQSSVCVGSNITSSPRALAILKNAIKTRYNSNISCDKTNDNNNTEDINRNTFDLNPINGTQSPPNHKRLHNSPFSRGSALLRAAKERLERQEIERSPKIMNYCNDYSFDRQLTGILRKHELQSSPTSSGEPKAKKKKVLFAEPVVSSKLEFKSITPMSSNESNTSIGQQFKSSVDQELKELNDKKRNNFVHQNSTFDKEFDTNSIDSNNSNTSDSPLLITQEFFTDSELNQHINTIEEQLEDSQDMNLLPLQNKMDVSADCEPQSSDSSGSLPCSQALPPSSGCFDETRISVGVQTESSLYADDDTIVNVPMRLSLIKQFYNLFGTLIKQYSDSSSDDMS